jgi:hypothetical protein
VPISPLARHAGAVAVAAGLLLAVLDIGRLAVIDPDDRVTSLRDPLAQTVNAAYFFGFVGLVIALVALYTRQAATAGGLGVVGYLAAIIGTMTQGGNMWFDGFAAPWLAEELPAAFAAPKTTVLLTGALLSYGLFTLGWVLLAVVLWRTGAVPALIALAVAAGGIVGFDSGMPPKAVLLGLALAAVGAWCARVDRRAAHAHAARPATARAPRSPR